MLGSSLVFVRNLYHRKNYEVKKKFYGVLLFTGILWIIALPIEIEIASNIRAYRRDFSVSISNLVLNIIFHGRFLLLFMPGSFNANFPFHAKTGIWKLVLA